MNREIQNDVLVMGKISNDGRTVILAPGVELPVRSVAIVSDVPAAPDGMPLTAIMFFANYEDREEFAELFDSSDSGMHFRELP